MKAVLRGICVAFLCAAGSAWVASSAQAGEYAIKQCNFANRAAPDMQLNASPASAFSFQNECSTAAWPYSTVWQGRTLTNGEIGAVRWSTPSGMGFRSVDLGYAVSGLGVVQMNDANNANPILISTMSTDYDDSVTVPGGGTRSILRAMIRCTSASCPNPGVSYATILDLSATISDFEAPVAAIGGTLLNGGTVSGNKTVRIIGVDGESGVHQTFIWVNGTIINSVNESCSTNRISPCPTPVDRTVTVNTAAPPFVEGLNAVTVCARDYATTTSPNQNCAAGQAVMVDN